MLGLPRRSRSLSLRAQKDGTSSNDSGSDHTKDNLRLDAGLHQSPPVSVLRHCSHIDSHAGDEASQGQDPEDEAQWMGESLL